MTSEQLRQLASNKRAEAAALDGSASRLRAIAGSIRDILSDIPGKSRDVWKGPAASEFEAQAGTKNGSVNAQADVMVSAATSFDSTARDLRSDAAWLDWQAANQDATGG